MELNTRWSHSGAISRMSASLKAAAKPCTSPPNSSRPRRASCGPLAQVPLRVRRSRGKQWCMAKPLRASRIRTPLWSMTRCRIARLCSRASSKTTKAGVLIPLRSVFRAQIWSIINLFSWRMKAAQPGSVASGLCRAVANQSSRPRSKTSFQGRPKRLRSAMKGSGSNCSILNTPWPRQAPVSMSLAPIMAGTPVV